MAATLLGLLPADSGQILVEGRPLPTDARARGRSLSMVFQNPYASLNPKMTIKAIVAEPLKVAFGLRGSALHAHSHAAGKCRDGRGAHGALSP
ncbi:hypothetical protein QZH46_08875 [Pseudomonas corrugata]